MLKLLIANTVSVIDDYFLGKYHYDSIFFVCEDTFVYLDLYMYILRYWRQKQSSLMDYVNESYHITADHK